MARSRRRSWPILLPTVVLVAMACGGTTAVTSGPPGSTAPGAPTAASPVGPGQSADDATAPPSGSLSADAITIDTQADPRVVGAGLENAQRASGRATAGMVDDLGPDATVLAAAMDQQASDELWAIVDDAASAEVSRAPTAMLASVQLPRSDRRSASIPPPGMSYLGPWIASVMLVDSSLGKDSAYDKKSHDEAPAELGANKGTVTTDSHVTVTPSGSRLVVDVDIKTKGEVSDANGRLIFRIDGSGHAHIDVQACPDGQGIATATMEFSVDELYFIAGAGGRVGTSWHSDDKADAQIYANDAADLDHTVINLETDFSIKGGVKAPGAGQTDLRNETITSSTTGATMDADSTLHAGDGTFQGHGTTMAEVKAAYNGSRTTIALAVYVTGKAAEKFWRSGKCIDVVVDPKGGDVGANSTTTVTAKVRQHFENTELDKPVQATMGGVKSIEPSGKKLPSPATFTYTAGPKPKDAGIVTFRSVSNRGIGETTVTFTVGGGWKVEGHDPAGATVDGQKCGGLGGPWKITSHLKDQGIATDSTYVATIDETTLAGTYTYKSVGTVDTGYGVITTRMTGNGKASLVAQADGSYLMTLAATTVKSTVTGAGSTQSVNVGIPALPFTWTPGGTCPA